MRIFRKNRKSVDTKRLVLAAGKGVPFSYIEAYKSLRTNIKFISSTYKAKSFIVTSAIPEESKTNTAINLAITLAQDGKRVILVDCDLRKPAIQKYLKVVRGTKGLTNIILGEKELEECIIEFSDINIDVLIAGTVPPNPSEILSSDMMVEIIEKLKEEYDYVIIDTPPVSIVTDATIVGNLVDGALLVIRSKFAPIDAVILGKRKLEEVGVRIFGVIITCFDVKKVNKKSGYDYSYSYEYNKK